MRDYLKLHSNHTLLEPDPEPEEEQTVPDSVVVDCVVNTFEERNGKTIAIKFSLRLPLK